MDKITKKWIKRLSQPNAVIKRKSYKDTHYIPYFTVTRVTRCTTGEEGTDRKGRPNWIIDRRISETRLQQLIQSGYLFGGDIIEINKASGVVTRWWWPTEKLYVDSDTV